MRGTLSIAAKLLLVCAVLFLGPLGVSAAVLEWPVSNWWAARRDSSGQAPRPDEHSGAVVQVYGARTVGWRGIFAIHTWISIKPEEAAEYTRYEVIGWGVERGVPAVRVNRSGPDNYWFGARPELLLDLRGEAAQKLIASIQTAIETYPYQSLYVLWPGPNSNTFIAHIAREVPELGLDLPPHAIGKDYLPNGQVFALAPSGTGLQISVLGVAGLIAAWEEGIEINLLGLSLGLDFNSLALRLPGLGRVGVQSGE